MSSYVESSSKSQIIRSDDSMLKREGRSEELGKNLLLVSEELVGNSSNPEQ
jgi:hypothetical protein